jgi:hypothetical protein
MKHGGRTFGAQIVDENEHVGARHTLPAAGAECDGGCGGGRECSIAKTIITP